MPSRVINSVCFEKRAPESPRNNNSILLQQIRGFNRKSTNLDGLRNVPGTQIVGDLRRWDAEVEYLGTSTDSIPPGRYVVPSQESSAASEAAP